MAKKMKASSLKASDVLKKAAEMLEKDLDLGAGRAGCCSFIGYVANHSICEQAYALAMKYMKDLFCNKKSYWFGNPWSAKTIEAFYKMQNRRITAMCLAAAVAESEGN